MDFSLVLFLTAVLMMEQKGSTGATMSAVSTMSTGSTGSTVATGSAVSTVPVSPSPFSSTPPHHREKRCSCENLKDRECVYFCHIGIVWVNTPSQVIPYGVGFLQMRPRRQVERCFCTHTSDTECVTFCSRRGGSSSLRSSPGILKEHFKAKEKKRRSSP